MSSSLVSKIKSGQRGFAYIVSHLTNSYGLYVGMSCSRVLLKKNGFKKIKQDAWIICKTLEYQKEALEEKQ